MATLHVRNIPESLHDSLRRTAGKERRTLGAQIITLLEEALLLRRTGRRTSTEIVEELRREREKIRLPRSWPGSLALLHEGRGGR